MFDLIHTTANQTLIDVAIQCYGNVDAIFEIIQDNELIILDLAMPIPPQTLRIRQDSTFINNKEIRELTTVATWQEVPQK
ncbi:MAG: hypothetical protein K2Q03_03560 [Sphingobacteriaceae bacterium]|nr:hypothetical protein [Sphingobacteriaceae bacterium]